MEAGAGSIARRGNDRSVAGGCRGRTAPKQSRSGRSRTSAKGPSSPAR
jgi:hypothetical protein